MPTLEILICTIDDGIRKIIDHLLSPIPHVVYLISWQQTHEYPEVTTIELANRNDVRIVKLKGKGLSRNRNNALKEARSNYLLISDDDVCYSETNLNSILEAFAKHPDADILTFQMCDKNGQKIKHYPSSPHSYPNTPKGFYYSSWEIALKQSPKIPLFDERFGLGADYLACGEEEVFIHEAYRRGAEIYYIPQVIGSTEKNTTGTLFYQDKRVRRSKGAVLYVLHGYFGAVLRCVKYAISLKKGNKLLYLIDMYNGIRYMLKSR